ncbi:MAG TPA: acyltransferase [Solirubrobacteraceae bacterium]|nr:acyltransferase [Solirubrobacteraceae bacterium]
MLQAPVRIEGEERIRLGAGVFIGAGSWLQTLHQPGHPPARLVIGDDTKCSGLCVISAAAQITLGRAVLLGRNVVIVDHNHASADPTLAIAEQGIDKLRPVEIQEGAWLAQNVVVCPGVSIGAHAVVGANSVVTRDLPPYCLAAGAPARVIRRREIPDADGAVAYPSEPL